MKIRGNPYRTFNEFVLRTPLFSLDFFKRLTSSEEISDAFLLETCQDMRVQEAIFLASPDLFKELSNWLEGRPISNKERVKFSILKYLSRMSSRCTPFGLFAGNAIGKFTEQSCIQLKDNTKYKRHTRLDMNYLVALSIDLQKNEIIRSQIKFYPNSSIYFIGRQIRYVEYEINKGNRIHHIVGIDRTDLLETLLNFTETGKTISQIIRKIVQDTPDVSKDEANAFVANLIESQFFQSELSPPVSGENLISHLISVLKKLNDTSKIVLTLEGINDHLKKLDDSLFNPVSNYLEITRLLASLGTEYELKYLFQTDLIVDVESNILDFSIARKVHDGLTLLNRISSINSQSNLKIFKQAFYDRYETQSVDLSQALDKELGIGFIQDGDYGDVSLLIDDLAIADDNFIYQQQKSNSSSIDEILHSKVIDAILNNNPVVKLDDCDLANLNTEWEDLPDTMSTIVELVGLGNSQKIFLSYVGGSCAANLLGRFCHVDSNIKKHVENIISYEEKINEDSVLAEIIHLPESRVGNILFRPHLREYEIPYLANSTIEDNRKIGVRDLELQARGPDTIELRSKKLQRKIRPRLTNAHNFSNGSLPIYQFLASFQFDNKRPGVNFEWGNWAEMFVFLPRIEYQNIILAPKTWNLKYDDIKSLEDNLETWDSFKNSIDYFIKKRKLDRLVKLKDGDNELLINFDNQTSVKMFIRTVKGRKRFQLVEFLHEAESIVKHVDENFANQIVVSFYNANKSDSR